MQQGVSKDINVIAFDTETNTKGKPYLLIFKNNGKLDMFDVENKDAEKVFMEYLYTHCRLDKHILKNQEHYAINVLFAHNLLFDLSAVLTKHHKAFCNNEFYIFGQTDDFKYIIEIKNSANTFGRIYFFKSRMHMGGFDTKGRKRNITRQCMLIDSWAFFRTSLAKAAKDLQLESQKAKRVSFIANVYNGLSDFQQHDIGYSYIDELLHYAAMDGHVQYDLAQKIIDIHDMYDVRISVSLPSLAARIFRRQFMREDDLLTFPEPYDVQHTAELSYHGGKNGFYLPHPQMIPDVYEVDVNSMYPYAMANIPNFNHCEYEFVDYFDEKKDGIYTISGYVEKSDYPLIPKHEFTGKNYFQDTYINDICVTSYELREALKNGLVSLDVCNGYVIRENESYNPFKEYVDYFFEKKKKCKKDDSFRVFYKLVLNALYGKTIQTTEITPIKSPFEIKPKYITIVEKHFECDTPKIYEAGGLYNPVIASLITGFARAYLFRLENKYKALDSSTDSVKTTKKPKTSKKLGGLSIKNFGDCLFIRNKFFIHFGETITYAKHGCQAPIEEILKMWILKKNRYTYERMIKVRESLIRKDLTPLTMQKMEAVLNVKWK